MSDRPTRVIGYVDGFNLYFGMRSVDLQAGYWLDLPTLLQRFLLPNQVLTATKYFTSRISDDPVKAKRQSDYLDALATLPGLTITYGRYQSHEVTCRNCQHGWTANNEKMTDVNIATELLSDFFDDKVDIAFLVSADSDLISAVRKVRERWPSKRVMALFPPGRGSVELQKECHGKRRIKKDAILASQMPDEVLGPDGYPKHRPSEWK